MSVRQIVHVIDDDPGMLESVWLLLLSEGFGVRTYRSVLDFLKTIKPGDKGCVVTDLRMPVMTGIDLLLEVEERGLLLPVIVMSAEIDTRLAVRVMELGAVDFVAKPFELDALIVCVRRALAMNLSRKIGSLAISGRGAEFYGRAKGRL
jgi:two-component system response regulator FixJ